MTVIATGQEPPAPERLKAPFQKAVIGYHRLEHPGLLLGGHNG